MEPVEKVALLALVYRELYNARHTGPDSLLDDFETCPGEVSLLGMMGSQSLTGLDWFVIEAMERPELTNNLAGDLAALDPIRAEALLHAWPGEQISAVRSLAEFRRWEEVETAMREFSELGVTMSRSDVAALAYRSYAQATAQTARGRPR